MIPFCRENDLLAKLGTGDAIEAYTRFSGLNSKFSMNIWRDSDHKLATVGPAGNRLRNCLFRITHILHNIGDQFSDTFKSGFRGTGKPAEARRDANGGR